MKNFQFAVFNTDKTYGQMNANANCHPEGLSASERVAIARANKSVIAKEVGFELPKLFMGIQGKERGTSYCLKREDVASYKDLFDYDVDADIVKMTPETAFDKTAIGFNVSDGANVVAMNLKTMEATSTFCAGNHIDAFVPAKIAEVLGGDPKDIYVDISPYAYVLPMMNPDDHNWIPNWITNAKAWDGCLTRSSDGVLFVNQQMALMNQLLESGILASNIFDRGDSYSNPNYYSSQRARMKADPTENGRFMHGVAYVEEGRTYENSNIKVYTRK